MCNEYMFNFGKPKVDKGLSSALRVNNTLHNQKVKKKREIFNV